MRITTRSNRYPIRVLIVDDSALIRKYLSQALNRTSFLKVVGTAQDGAFALEKIETLSPDVVLLDFHMPRIDGIETLKHIMKHHPVPVVMFSSVTREGALLTIKALKLGAVDFMPKPMGSLLDNMKYIYTELITKITTAANSKVEVPGNWFGRNNPGCRMPSSGPRISSDFSGGLINNNYTRWEQLPFFAIGCSTGGPRALEQIIWSLPADFPSPVAVVQHMPDPFLSVYAEHLNSKSKLKVKIATPYARIEPGTVFLAPGNAHMRICRLGTRIVASLHAIDSPGLGKFPSADHLFSSVARTTRERAVGIVLSGMGKDGTKGLRAIKLVGGYTIAQDRASATVYGMPGAARAQGLIDKVLNPGSIAKAMKTMAGFGRIPDDSRSVAGSGKRKTNYERIHENQG